MAEVTGPIHTLPGSLHSLPEGAVCDEHEDRPAIHRIQGETDSFGSEMFDVCQECYDRHLAYVKHRRENPEPEICDWCKQTKLTCVNKRDLDEGMAGPVYRVCKECRDAENKRLSEELAADSDDDWPDYGIDYYDDDAEEVAR